MGESQVQTEVQAGASAGAHGPSLRLRPLEWAGLALLAAACLFRIYLAATGNLTVLNGASGYDDDLLIRLAERLVLTKSLGAYSEYTLAKGPMFSVFLAALHVLHIPYGVGTGLVIVITCLTLCLAMRARQRAVWPRVLLTIFVMYNPIGFSADCAMRVYRDVLVPWLVTGIFSCIIALWYRRTWPARRLTGWAAAGSFYVFTFWFLREDGAWILPFMLTAALIIGGYEVIVTAADSALPAASRWKCAAGRGLSRLVLASSPLLIGLAGGTLLLSAVNYAHYGLFAVNDRAGTSCADLMEELYSIDDGVTDKRSSVWLSRAALELALEESESLASLDGFQDAWSVFCLNDLDPDEVEGDIAEWAVRAVVASNGYYADAAGAEAFYRQAVSELREAFREGRLTKKGGITISSQIRPLYPEDFTESLANALQVCRFILQYFRCQPRLETSKPGRDWLARYESLLRQPILAYNKDGSIDTGDAANAALMERKQYNLTLTGPICTWYQKYWMIITGIALLAWAAELIATLLSRRTPHRFTADLLLSAGLAGGAYTLPVCVWLYFMWHNPDVTTYYLYRSCCGSFTTIALAQAAAVLAAWDFLPQRRMKKTPDADASVSARDEGEEDVRGQGCGEQDDGGSEAAALGRDQLDALWGFDRHVAFPPVLCHTALA